MDVVDQTFDKTSGAALLFSGLRATLISGAASICPASDIKRMQTAASTAYHAAANFADSGPNFSMAVSFSITATRAAARSAASPFSASSANATAASSSPSTSNTSAAYASSAAISSSYVLKANRASPAHSAADSATFTDADCGRDGDPYQIFAAPLWPNSDAIAPLLEMWTDFEALPDPTGIWSFWRDWYRSMLQGTPLNWDLQLQVALIDDSIWQAGPEAIAKEIARIQAQMLSEKLPMAEMIEINPDTGKYRAVPIPVKNPATFSALLSQIEDALEDCLGGHNGLAERSGNVKKLNRVLTKYKDDPQNAELTLTRVAGSLRSQLHDTRDLPDNEENLSLLNAVEEGVRGIRANHPEVAKNRDQLAQQAIHALTPEDKDLLQQALPVLAEISEPELADDFETDIPELITDALLPLPDGAPPLPGADVTTRIFSRVSKMALLIQNGKDLAQKGAGAFDSDVVKSIRLAGLAVSATGGIGGILFALFKVGLTILGVL